MITPFHAKYFAHDLTRRAANGMDRLSMALFDAAVDLNSFRYRYASAGSSITDLRQPLSGFCKRTLRNQVTEYIRYTERRPITRPFTPSDDEHALYEAVSGFLQREDSYALPERQRQEIFKTEDEIMEKRDRLVESLEKRLAQRTGSECLFTIRWAVA